jgi:hypothetical protein
MANKTSVFISILLIAGIMTACGDKSNIQTHKITSVRSDTIELDKKPVSLKDTILIGENLTNVKAGQEGYIATGNNRKYLVVYSGDKINKTKDGLDIFAKIKDISPKGITISNGTVYEFGKDVSEQNISDNFTKINRFNINDLSKGDIVRFFVKDGKIIAVVKY